MMAYVTKADLIDALRHEFGVDDETGLCTKILGKASRRPKPGGLPLGFQQHDDAYESDEDQYSPGYMVYFDELSTRSVIDSRLRSKTTESEKSVISKSVASCSTIVVPGRYHSTPEPLDIVKTQSEKDFLKYRNPKESITNFASVTSKLVDENPQTLHISLTSYAEVESADPSTGRELLVFYPFADAKEGERYGCSLRLRVQPKATIGDLIGFCCYAYMRSNRKPPINDVNDYRLLMAEDNGEVDRDLPPIDMHRCLDELGSCWSTVALVHRSEISSIGMDNKVVLVYTVNGSCYEFHLESLDVTLRWLRDRALERRIAEEGDSFMCSTDYPELREYLLEMINERDVPLNLDMTIASTACTEFLMLRKNSSRGDFRIPLSRPSVLPEYAREASFTSALPSAVSDTLSPKPGVYHRSISSISPTSPTPNDLADLGPLIAEYLVDWLHRYKPKWSASFALYDMGFELHRCQLERKRTTIGLLLSPSKKHLRVLWDQVGASEIIGQSSTKRVIRITWLAMPEQSRRTTGRFDSTVSNASAAIRSGSFSSTTGSVGSFQSEMVMLNPAIDAQAYEGSRWKTVQLEVDVDDAWNIVQKCNDKLDSRNSDAHLLYMNSSGGKKKPSAVAGKMLTNGVNTENTEKKYATLPRERLRHHVSVDTATTTATTTATSTTAKPRPRPISRTTSVFAGHAPAVQKRI